MRKLIAIAILATIHSFLFSQAPDAMSFQAVVRDANSTLIQNTSVGMQISILEDSVNGQAVYIERHTLVTNVNGLATLMIGAGTVVTGNFSSIDWANGPYFLKTETDLTGGTAYTISGTSQLLSVPYAKYAEKAGDYDEVDPMFISSPAAGITANDLSNWDDDLVFDGDSSQTNELQVLQLNQDTLILSDGNYVVLPKDQDWTQVGNKVYNEHDSIGIGTFDPVTNLDVVGGFRFEDGNEGEGKILMSDSSGLAHWDTLVNPSTFYVTNPNWSVSGPGNVEHIYCSITLTLEKKSLVSVSSGGHMMTDVGHGIISGIVFPGESLIDPNNTRVYTDLKLCAFGGAYAYMWYPANSSRSKILEPGTHTISLSFANSGGVGSVWLNGAAMTGHIIPFN